MLINYYLSSFNILPKRAHENNTRSDFTEFHFEIFSQEYKYISFVREDSLLKSKVDNQYDIMKTMAN